MTKILSFSLAAVIIVFALLGLSLVRVNAQETDQTITDQTTEEITEETTEASADDSTAAEDVSESTEEQTNVDANDTSSDNTIAEDSTDEIESSEETVSEEETYEQSEENVTEDESIPEEETVAEDTTTKTQMVGQIIEIEGTEVPTTIIIQKITFSTGEDGYLQAEKGDQYTINIDSDTEIDFQLNWWMAGDMVRVHGDINETTELIDAEKIDHLTSKGRWNIGHNGWIEEINTEENYLQIQWYGKLTKVNISDETRIIIPGEGDVTIDKLELQDRVRVRAEKIGEGEILAKTVMLLRRGETKYIKLRTKKMVVTFVEDLGDGTFTVTGRRKTYSVNITEDTKIVIDKEEVSDLSNFSSGDRLFLVTRLNDDGTFDAKLIRNFVSLEEGGSVVGTIVRLDKNNTVIALRIGRAVNRAGYFRVDVTDSTTIQDEQGQSLAMTDLESGMRIRIEGSRAENHKRQITASNITIIDVKTHKERIKRQMGR